MSEVFRTMRVIVMFDLPTKRTEEKRAYAEFRKGLESLGFLRLQHSVYSRLVLSRDAVEPLMSKIRAICPNIGEIVAFIMTEQQYAKREIILGTGSCAAEVGAGEQMALVL